MKIKAVTEQLHIAPETLRYWERVGAIPPVNRDEAGYRDYDQEDIEWIEFAQCMRDAGVSVEYLIEYIDLFRQGKRTVQARKDLLNEQLATIKAKLDDVQATYDKIQAKIANYDTHVEGYHGKLRPLAEAQQKPNN